MKAEAYERELSDYRKRVDELLLAAKSAERVLADDEDLLLARGFGWARGIRARLGAALADLEATNE